MATIAGDSSIRVAPVRGWRKAATDSMVVGGTTFLCQAIGVVTSVTFRALLDPAQMGIWQGLKLVLEYGNFASLGVSKGATRELTIALGSGDHKKANRLAHLGFTFNTLTSAAYSAAMLVAAAAIWWTGATKYPVAWSIGLVGMALLSVLHRHVSFEVTVLRARQFFSSTSLLNLLEATSMLVAGVAAVKLLGLPGMYVATAVTLLASMMLLRSVRETPYCWHWNLSEIRRLAAIGTPILLIGLGTTAMRSLDRWMILGFSANREVELGLYSVALLVTTQLAGVSGVFAIVMGPRYGELLGHSGERTVVAQLAARITELKALLMMLPGMVAVTIGPSVLIWLLPGYEAGLTAMLIRVPGAIARALAVPANQLMITVDQQRRALLALIPPFAFGVVAAWFAVHKGWGLIGVAWAMTLSDVLFLIIQGAAAFGWSLRPVALLRCGLSLLCSLVPLTWLAMSRASSAPGAMSLEQSSLLLLACLAIWSLAAMLMWRMGGWAPLSRKDKSCDA